MFPAYIQFVFNNVLLSIYILVRSSTSLCSKTIATLINIISLPLHPCLDQPIPVHPIQCSDVEPDRDAPLWKKTHIELDLIQQTGLLWENNGSGNIYLHMDRPLGRGPGRSQQGSHFNYKLWRHRCSCMTIMLTITKYVGDQLKYW